MNCPPFIQASSSTVHKHRQSPLTKAHRHRPSPSHRHRKSLVSAVYNSDRAPCFAPSLPPHLVTVSPPLLGARDPRFRRAQLPPLLAASPRAAGGRRLGGPLHLDRRSLLRVFGYRGAAAGTPLATDEATDEAVPGQHYRK
ncbi:hypothetical protein NDU88_006154 [Pleurodeles waltl]|uniref:Uncharacterized protein n=1 Tax=Pleurodeles waltl TaxID=8319 RepID=A0AAV7RR75_PLEWA|nr:hypothetical protein NDU88_006154 [Pleurodeles waltl]